MPKTAPGKKGALTGKSGLKTGAGRRKKRTETYNRYLFRVLTQINGGAGRELGMSKAAMRVMNSFCNDVFDRITAEAARLCRTNKRKTVSTREIETAVNLILGGGSELGTHARAEATKALTNSRASLHGRPTGSQGYETDDSTTLSVTEIEEDEEDEETEEDGVET